MILVVFGPLLALWVFLIWRVRVEGGDVGIVWTPMRRLSARWSHAFNRMAYSLGAALLPAVQGAVEAMRRWAETVDHLGLEEALAEAERDRARP